MIHAENERSTACTLRGDAYALTKQRQDRIINLVGVDLHIATA
ncbi:hypothetical protein [Mesorhizobium sp. LNHC252B00]|nr:hypothetical protein [Mesorhizobium sp. LNHC252B00]